MDIYLSFSHVGIELTSVAWVEKACQLSRVYWQDQFPGLKMKQKFFHFTQAENSPYR